MNKKIALVFAILLTLTLAIPSLVQNPAAYPPPTPQPGPGGVYHWKIELAQKKCDAVLTGTLYNTTTGLDIEGTAFILECNQDFVFWKVKTVGKDVGIRAMLNIDWNKDGIPDEPVPVQGPLTPPTEPYDTTWLQFVKNQTLIVQPVTPIPYPIVAPICTYWAPVSMVQEIWINDELYEHKTVTPASEYHITSWDDSGWPAKQLSTSDQIDVIEAPSGLKSWWHVKSVIPGVPGQLVLERMVVVEVHNQPYDSADPYFEWQLTLKAENCTAQWTGFLTLNDAKLTNTDFDIVCNALARSDTPTVMNCKVVTTNWCTVPNDIDSTLVINGVPGALDVVYTQFPWNLTIVGQNYKVELELTEVQSYHYWLMGGEITSNGWLRLFDPWYWNGTGLYAPVPFASRAPYVTPWIMGQVITFTQRNPITGIVKLSIPAVNYSGLDHIYYSTRVGKFFRVRVILEQMGCGWLWTGDGKNPVYGCVDRKTYNNLTGLYTYGLDGVAGTSDDELLAAKVANTDDPRDPGPAYHAAGAGAPIGPCLQNLRGVGDSVTGPIPGDNIPCTADDPLGRADSDGPDQEPGHSVIYLPSTMAVTYHNGTAWVPLFGSPWPQLLTTGSVYDKVIVPPPPPFPLNGWSFSRTGKPWEFYAGLDHPAWKVTWNHPYSNAYATYVTTWSVMGIDTSLSDLDVHFVMVQKSMRDDCCLPDILDDNEYVTIGDVRRAGKAYDTYDEGFGKIFADKLYDAGADVKGPVEYPPGGEGYVGIADVRRVAKDYEMQLTPTGIKPA